MEDFQFSTLTQQFIRDESNHEAPFWNSQPCNRKTVVNKKCNDNGELLQLHVDSVRPLQSTADPIAESKPTSKEIEQRVPGSVEEWDFSCSSNIVENDLLEFSSFSQPPCPTIATRQQHFWLACNEPEEFLTQPPSRKVGQNKQSVVSEELSAVITSHRRESALIISENEMTSSHLDDHEVHQQTIESETVCIEKTVSSGSPVSSTRSPKIRSLESDDKLVKNCQQKLNENTLPNNECPNAIVHAEKLLKEINLRLVEDHVSNEEGSDATINNVRPIPSPPPFPPHPPTHPIAHLSELKFPNDASAILPVFSFSNLPSLLTKDTLVNRLSAGLTERPITHSLPPELELRLETYTMKSSRNKQSKDVLENESQSEPKSDNPEEETAEQPVCKKSKLVEAREEHNPTDHQLVSDDVPVIDHALLTSPCVDRNSDHVVPVTPGYQPRPSSVETTTTTTQSLSSCLVSHRAETTKTTATTTNFTSNSLPERRKIMEAKCLLGVPFPNLNYNLSRPKIRVGLSRKQVCPSLHLHRNNHY